MNTHQNGEKRRGSVSCRTDWRSGREHRPDRQSVLRAVAAPISSRFLARRRFLGQAATLAAAAGFKPSGLFAADPPAADFSRRFCICNELFGDWPFEKAFALAAECGYRGLEIAPFTMADDVRKIAEPERRRVRNLAQQHGLTIVGLHWLLAKTTGVHLTSPDESVRRKTTDYFAALARFCADLGGTLMVLGSPKQRNLLPGVRREDALRYAADVIGRLLPVLDETKVTLALEPLSPGTTNFLTTAAEAVELIAKVGSPRCRLNLDCLAMSSEKTPLEENLRQSREHLVHFHANDPNQQGPGFGKLDFVPIFRTLKAIDYRGWISVEVFDLSPGPERLTRQSIEYMRKSLAS